MEGKRLIEKIRLRNILSFGDKGEEIELQPLNIIIGQNASGKSNLIDVIKLLHALPQMDGLANFIGKNGGISEWIWKGNKTEPYLEIEIELSDSKEKIKYELILRDYSDKKTTVVDEGIVKLKDGKRYEDKIFSNFERSILSGLNYLNEGILEREWLREKFSEFVFFLEVNCSRNSKIREPQLFHQSDVFLIESGENLFLVLKDLENKVEIKKKIIENLQKFNSKTTNYSFKYLAEYIFLFVHEKNLEKPISAMRLSDGTLRYLCLLAILCHPEPPPLICIEEPETGLHPDILPTIAELMKEASQRTQLIVTTHSDILVSAFSDMPEAVLVCEKDEDGTHFKRLNEEELKIWMEEYTDLGEIWLRGGIGGTRW